MYAKLVLLLFLSGTLGVSCTKKSHFESEKFVTVEIAGLPEDVKLPSQAWDLIGINKEALPTRKVILSAVKVYLLEKNEGILSKPALKLSLPVGGGNIDLAKFVGLKKGTFYVGFEFEKFEKAEEKKIIFVSKTNPRKINDELLGQDCNTIIDLSKVYFEGLAGEGFKVNTSELRYLSILGGTFLFSAKHGNELNIAQVSFGSSLHPQLFCKE